MGDAADRSQALDDLAVGFEHLLGFRGFARERAGGEHAALMGNVERRGTVSVGLGEDDFAFGDYAVDVVDGAGDELLEEIEGLLVT